MSSVPDADPADLSLPDIDSELEIGKGPRIDSSDEFPLPSFDGEEETGISADVLFPMGDEPTAEEMPVAEPKKSEAPKADVKPTESEPPKIQAPPGSFELGSDEELADLDVALTESKEPMLPSITFDEEPEESLDADYFEEGLQDEPRSKSVAAVAEETRSVGQAQGGIETPVKLPEPPLPPEARATATPVPTLELPQNRASTQPPPDLRKPSSPEQSGLTPPGPPQASLQTKPPERKSESSIDEIFFDGGDTSTNASTKSSGNVSREDWVEDVPVDKYVRKVKVKRKSSRKPKVRMWVPAAGVAALVIAFVASKPVFNSLHHQEFSAPVLVVASNPQAEVYSGDQLLGATPLALSAELAAKPDLQIRKDGYKPAVIPIKDGEGTGDAPVSKFVPTLEIQPVQLSWDGFPADATLWWNGQKVAHESLKEVLPGEYSVKVKPKSGPSVSTKVTIEAAAGAVPVGNQVAEAFAQQPKAKIALKMPDEKSKAGDLGLTLTRLDKNQPFSSKVTVSSSTTAEVAVPGPGKYKLSFAGNGKFKAASEEIELASGATKEISLALAKQPPKVVAPSQPTYRPSTPTYRPTYRPPPRRPYSGGGGGGGRIAPPAF